VELVEHAVEHGHPAGQEVSRLMAKRLGVDPVNDGGRIGKHLWPVVKGEKPPGGLLRAARWAEEAMRPGMVATKTPLEGFLIVASGNEMAWPVAEGSEAARVRERPPSPLNAAIKARRQEHAAKWARLAEEAARREQQDAIGVGNAHQTPQDAPGRDSGGGVDKPIDRGPAIVPRSDRTHRAGTGEKSDAEDDDIKYVKNDYDMPFMFDVREYDRIFNKDTPESAWAKFEEFKRRRLAGAAC
jgi:hypothetical protein